MLTIIDADSLIYLSLPKKHNEDATFEYCLDELHQRFNDILVKTNATKYILCITEGKCFRYKKWKFSTDYKDNRKDSKPHPFFFALKESMKNQLNVISNSKLEADDLVCIIANECGEEYTVASIDKDVKGQIAGIHFDYRKNCFEETRKEDVEYNTWKQVLVGDIMDGVYGIRGIGNKTADKLFQNRQDYYHVVLEQYIKNYGIYEGINRFYENYSMIYLLRSFVDVKKEIGEDMNLPKFVDVERDKKTSLQW